MQHYTHLFDGDQQYGFSLIEILCALMLSVFIMFSAGKVYLVVRRNHQWQENWMSWQARGDFLQYFLSARLRMAGYAECNKQVSFVNQQQAIHGYASHQVPAYLQAQVISGSDVFVVGQCVNYQQRQQFIKMAYYIGKTSRRDSQGNFILALFMKPEQGPRQELVTNVVKMKVEYGVREVADKGALRYLSAEQISNWLAVKSVVVYLLLRSADRLPLVPANYYFYKHWHTASGGYSYQPWIIYTALRQR